MNDLIFCKKTLFQKLYFWTHRYISMSNSIGSMNDITLIQEDILSSSENRLVEYKCSQIENKLLDRLLNKKILNRLQNIYTKEQCKDIFGKKLVIEAKKILISFRYAESVAVIQNIKKPFYLWPNDFDYSIYKVLKDLNLLPNNIKITKAAFIKNIIESYLKNIYFLYKSFFIFERNIFTKKNYKSKINKFKYIIHMDQGLEGWDLLSKKYLIDNEVVNQQEVLFINSDSYKPKWVNEYLAKNFNVLNMFELYKIVNRKDAYDVYKKYFKIRIMIIYIIFNKSWLISQLFFILKDNFEWELFYKNYDIQKSISIMSARSITESLIHKRMDTQTYFIYFSVTENILTDIDDPKVSQCHDYSHMHYDYLITNKISAKWIETLQTKINNTIILGPILSDEIVRARNNKYKLIDKLNLKKYKHIITYIDTPTGLYAESSISEYKNFIRSLIILSNNNKDSCYLFKTKKTVDSILGLNDSELNKIIKDVLSSTNIKYINDCDISLYEAIGMSGFTISGRKSSVIYEALHAGQPVICYDTSKPLIEKYLYHQIKTCNAATHDELTELHNYWMINYQKDDLSSYHAMVDTTLNMSSNNSDSFQKLRNEIAC